MHYPRCLHTDSEPVILKDYHGWIGLNEISQYGLNAR